MSAWAQLPTAEGTALFRAPRGEELDWQLYGLCRQPGEDPERWFPEGPEKSFKARQVIEVCKECPVRQECAEWALRVHEEYGIWGALTERQRRAIWGQKRHQKAS